MVLYKLKQGKKQIQAVFQGQVMPWYITISHLLLTFIKFSLYCNDLSISGWVKSSHFILWWLSSIISVCSRQLSWQLPILWASYPMDVLWPEKQTCLKNAALISGEMRKRQAGTIITFSLPSTQVPFLPLEFHLVVQGEKIGRRE